MFPFRIHTYCKYINNERNHIMRFWQDYFMLSAVDTALLFQLDAEERKAVEESVNSAQRAEETAEHSVDEDRTHDKADHQHELPGEERAEHIEHALVIRVDQQGNSTAEGARGTNILTEAGEREVLYRIDERENDHEKDEHDVLEVGEHAGEAVLFELRGLDLM